jgi:hypothetical protein
MFKKTTKRSTIPKFTSSDKGLQEALNVLGSAINAIVIPDIRMVGGTQEWRDNQVLLRPERVVNSTSSTYIPWKPIFSVTDGQHLVGFNLGTINSLVPTNWATKHALAFDDTKYVILTATGDASSGNVTGCSLSIADSPPTATNATEGVAPASFTIVLGVINALKSIMPITYNLNATARETFRQAIAAPVDGGESFVRFWGWEVQQDVVIS